MSLVEGPIFAWSDICIFRYSRVPIFTWFFYTVRYFRGAVRYFRGIFIIFIISGSLRRDPLYEIQIEAILKRLDYRPGLSGNEVGQMKRVGENV